MTDSCSCYQTVNYTCPAGYYCPYAPGTNLDYNQAFLDANLCTYVNESTTNKLMLQCNCTPGFYCPANTSQPDYCCKGFYCPTPSEAYICPEGSYCLTGFVEHKSCNILNKCKEGSDSSGKLSSFVLLVFVIVVILIFFQVKKVLHGNAVNAYAEKLAAYQESKSFDKDEDDEQLEKG